MSEYSNQPLQNSGICEFQRRGLSHMPGDYPCSRVVLYDGFPTREDQGSEVVVRRVMCPKILRVTNEVATWDSADLSASAGKAMTVYKSELVTNPNANQVDAQIAGYNCLEPPLEFPYLHISMEGLRRQNR